MEIGLAQTHVIGYTHHHSVFLQNELYDGDLHKAPGCVTCESELFPTERLDSYRILHDKG